MIDGHTARLLSFVSIQWIRWTSDNFCVCFPPQKSLGCCISCPSSHFSKRNMSIRVTLAICVNGHTNTKSTNMCLLPHCIPRRISRLIFVQMGPAQPSPAQHLNVISFLIKRRRVRLFHLKLFKCPTTNNKDKKKKAQDRNVIHFIFPASSSKEISNHPRVAILVAILYIDDEYSILVTVYQIKKRPAGKRKKEMGKSIQWTRSTAVAISTHTYKRPHPFFLLLFRYIFLICEPFSG
jgi:hypothetical protein